jgi:hypothetical protein
MTNAEIPTGRGGSKRILQEEVRRGTSSPAENSIAKAFLLRGESDGLARSPHGVRRPPHRRTLFDKSQLFRLCS